MILVFLGPLHQGGGINVVAAGAGPYAGVVWRVASGAGAITPYTPRADAAGIASARYTCNDAPGEIVRVEVEAYA